MRLKSEEQEMGGEVKKEKRSKVMRVQSLTILNDDTQAQILVLDQLQDSH